MICLESDLPITTGTCWSAKDTPMCLLYLEIWCKRSFDIKCLISRGWFRVTNETWSGWKHVQEGNSPALNEDLKRLESCSEKEHSRTWQAHEALGDMFRNRTFPHLSWRSNNLRMITTDIRSFTITWTFRLPDVYEEQMSIDWMCSFLVRVCIDWSCHVMWFCNERAYHYWRFNHWCWAKAPRTTNGWNKIAVYAETLL